MGIVRWRASVFNEKGRKKESGIGTLDKKEKPTYRSVDIRHLDCGISCCERKGIKISIAIVLISACTMGAKCREAAVLPAIHISCKHGDTIDEQFGNKFEIEF